MKEMLGNTKNKLIAAAAGLGLVASGAVIGAKAHEEVSQPSAGETATAQITQAQALEHYHDVLPGTAVVITEQGQTNIENPIIAQTEQGVAVAERTTGSDAGELSLVTSHAVGEAGVTEIRYFDDGEKIGSDGTKDPAEAIAATIPVGLERAPGLSVEGNNAFIPVGNAEELAGAINNTPANPADIPVAQGTDYPR